ncbi:hypothetical protein GUJ93_ZPchr0004g40466 [Zizania palustris]|uniref:Uncharacterized protein n=1 Tax=Zizania palustris TaxID=103762 RepID=A0A8J5V8D3_ZIZPA|nr:hypothetical protein GUJ93_ZPchr0004g40466 [Zizania palustris]
MMSTGRRGQTVLLPQQQAEEEQAYWAAAQFAGMMLPPQMEQPAGEVEPANWAPAQAMMQPPLPQQQAEEEQAYWAAAQIAGMLPKQMVQPTELELLEPANWAPAQAVPPLPQQQAEQEQFAGMLPQQMVQPAELEPAQAVIQQPQLLIGQPYWGPVQAMTPPEEEEKQ